MREGERKKKNHERGNRQHERNIEIEMEREEITHRIYQKVRSGTLGSEFFT